MKNKSIGGLVYSTDGGRMCPLPPPRRRLRLPGRRAGPAGDGVARIWRESKGRGGRA